ncbi:unnamed protein product, partial [Owenia fusiformis]
SFCKCSPMYHDAVCSSRYTRSQMAECTAWGDIHFESFDEADFHIQNDLEMKLVNGYGTMPHFEVRVLPYFKSPGDRVSYIKRISILTRGDTKQTLIEILHKDSKG